MHLHIEHHGSGRPVAVLHGLMGSSANWRTFAARLADHFHVLLIDLPNHGRSPHVDPFDLCTMAEDVHETLRDADIARTALIGHSLGGKVAMRLATEHPEQVDTLIVVDISPKPIPPAHLFILRACRELDLSLPCRADLDASLAGLLPDPALRGFLLKNLNRDEVGGWHWQVGLDALIDNYAAISGAVPLTRPATMPTLFIAGEKSSFRILDDQPLIERWFPAAQFAVIPQAGHLVHTDQPDAFAAQVLHFLRSIEY